MRPINNVVDVSNYVMLELGQPNHTYDLAKLEGGGFRIRKARDGEKIVTLDGVEREVTAADVLICDGNDVAIGIGGVMGGLSTEIDEHTTSVALEMAWFDPPTIAATAGTVGPSGQKRRRGSSGEPTPRSPTARPRRFVELLRLTCPDAQLHSEIDARGELPSRAPVPLRLQRVNALLGATLTVDDITPAASVDRVRGRRPVRRTTSCTSRSRRGATTARSRSTSSKRSLACTATRGSRRPCRSRRIPAG